MQDVTSKRKNGGELLQGTRLWRSGFLSEEERRALEDAVVSSTSISADVELVAEGGDADNLLFICEGWACRYTTTSEGNRQLLTILMLGDLCNLTSLLFDRADFGVRTLTPATILTLPRRSALELGAQHPGIARTITWLALVENASLSRLALTLGRRSAKEKLAHLFCELSVRLSMQGDDDIGFEFPLTQEQIGDALGLTNVHVNRTMQALRAEGLVATKNRTMTLRNISKLRHIAGFDPRYLYIEGAEAGAR